MMTSRDGSLKLPNSMAKLAPDLISISGHPSGIWSQGGGVVLHLPWCAFKSNLSRSIDKKTTGLLGELTMEDYALGGMCAYDSDCFLYSVIDAVRDFLFILFGECRFYTRACR